MIALELQSRIETRDRQVRDGDLSSPGCVLSRLVLGRAVSHRGSNEVARAAEVQRRGRRVISARQPFTHGRSRIPGVPAQLPMLARSRSKFG
jgi:hypothetical protein